MNEKILSPKSLLNERRESVLALSRTGRSLWLADIDIKNASNIIAWVKALHPKRRFESSTEDGGVRVWRIK